MCHPRDRLVNRQRQNAFCREWPANQGRVDRVAFLPPPRSLITVVVVRSSHQVVAFAISKFNISWYMIHTLHPYPRLPPTQIESNCMQVICRSIGPYNGDARSWGRAGVEVGTHKSRARDLTENEADKTRDNEGMRTYPRVRTSPAASVEDHSDFWGQVAVTSAAESMVHAAMNSLFHRVIQSRPSASGDGILGVEHGVQRPHPDAQPNDLPSPCPSRSVSRLATPGECRLYSPAMPPCSLLILLSPESLFQS